MNAMTIETTELQCTLKPGNKAVYDCLTRAISAIYHLDDAGATALNIELRGAKPIITVDQAPAFVQGVATVTMRHGRNIDRRMAAPYHGAQIEWMERELLPPPSCEVRRA
jgi:hypothetical protein